MYKRTNPAVIKSYLLRLTKSELQEEIQILQSKIIELDAGNKRTMFIQLYKFTLNQLPHAKQSSYKL